MKKSFVKLIAVICVLALSVALMTGCGGNKELYEKYGYDQKFQYSDEMIGHALKSTVMQIRMTYNARVRYYPVTVDEQSVIQLLIMAYDEYSEQYDADTIMQAVMSVVKDDITEYLVFGTQKEVEISPMYTGSGVVISEDGYIATNSHVISLTDDEKNDIYISALLTGVEEDLDEIVESLSGYGMEMSDEDVKTLYEIIAYASVEDMQVISENAYIEVCFPTSDGNTSESAAKHYPATVAAEGTQHGVDGLTQDTAILKIAEDNLVALTLDEEYPATATEIISAGFPGADNAIFESAGSEASNLSLTVTKGSVTGLKAIEGTNYQAIGKDSVTSGGSSGGPSVDSCLRVEGLNTYAYADDQRFGYMVPAEYVRYLSQSFDIGQETISKNFLTGIQLLQNGYGASALECFEYVAATRPDTPYIDQLIDLAEKAPQKKYATTNWTLIIIIVAAAVAVIGIVIFIIILTSHGKKKKNKYPPAGGGYGGGYGGGSSGDLFLGSSSSNQSYNYNSNNRTDSWRL